MSRRESELCGCWKYYNDNDVVTSSGRCVYHWHSQEKLEPTFTRSLVLAYLERERDFYAKSFAIRGAIVLDEVIDRVRFGALEVFSDLSDKAPHEKHTPHPSTNENPDAMRATNRDSGESNEP